VLKWNPKEHLLKMWQIHDHVNILSNKFISKDMIIPQDSQMGGLENKQSRVVKLMYHVVPTKRGSVNLNMCHHIEKNKVMIPLETSDKCKNNQSLTSQKNMGNKLNH
jgi:hypothetical protein